MTEPPHASETYVNLLAWAAGLYEGEGTAAIGKNGTPVVQLSMTDPEPVYRFQETFGVGKVFEYQPMQPKKDGTLRKLIYRYQVWRRDDVIHILTLLLGTQLLSPRRTEQAQRVLDRAKEIDPTVRGITSIQRKADLELLRKVGLK